MHRWDRRQFRFHYRPNIIRIPKLADKTERITVEQDHYREQNDSSDIGKTGNAASHTIGETANDHGREIENDIKEDKKG